MTPEEHFLAELSKRLPANANLSTFDLLQVLEACGLSLNRSVRIGNVAPLYLPDED